MFTTVYSAVLFYFNMDIETPLLFCVPGACLWWECQRDPSERSDNEHHTLKPNPPLEAKNNPTN